MRYPPDQKAKAREALLKAGAGALKANGFNGIGVDGVAAAAGVTSGAFYSNFASKEALLEQVIQTCLGEPFIDIHSGGQAEQHARLREWLAMYISADHRGRPGMGCVMPALSADVARSMAPVKEAYGREISQLVARMAGVLGGEGPDRERRAWSIVAMMVGAIAITRAMPDGDGSNKALASVLETANALVQPLDR
jgi:TetR/AcrR family transcriptional regulator, transcriptional repressor for nem operon